MTMTMTISDISTVQQPSPTRLSLVLNDNDDLQHRHGTTTVTNSALTRFQATPMQSTSLSHQKQALVTITNSPSPTARIHIDLIN